MKKLTFVFILLCGAIAGAIVCLNWQKAAPVVQTASDQTTDQAQPGKIVAPKPEHPQMISTGTEELAQTPRTTPVANEARPGDATNSIGKAVDVLLSAKNGGQKHTLFQQLAQSGELDQVIAELQQRAKDNPNNPEIPTTLGEALLNKVRATLAANDGQSSDDIRIMAVQADQSFNAALKIDPQNWEAQFVKAAAMERWPASPQMDNDVVQRLSNLVDQQETMPSQPEFAQTYVVLGNEFQKIGQPDKAKATWLLGAQKFPNDPTLQQKINGQ